MLTCFIATAYVIIRKHAQDECIKGVTTRKRCNGCLYFCTSFVRIDHLWVPFLHFTISYIDAWIRLKCLTLEEFIIQSAKLLRPFQLVFDNCPQGMYGQE